MKTQETGGSVISHSSNLLSDTPISGDGASPDGLHRKAFAKQVVSQFLSQVRDGPLVISIEGAWGTGKTSTFNLLKRHLRKTEAIVIDFNPWMIGSTEAMTQAFLVQLAAEIGLADRAKEGQEAAKQLVSYSGVFDVLKLVPGAEPWASILSAIVKKVGGATATIADLKSLSLDKRRKAVETALVRLDKPIIAFVDDLDRLAPIDVFSMIRVIKAIADFPRMTYVLAFDVEHIVAALNKAGVDQGAEYVEKLIQVRLNLPAIASSDLLAMLESETAKLPPTVLEPFQTADEGRLGMLYHSGLSVLIETPRDIRRIFNRLAFSAKALAGEIAFPELLALEVLAVKCPSVYERIYKDPEYFLKKKKPQLLQPKKSEDPFDAVVCDVRERYRPHAKNLLHVLFPGVGDTVSDGEHRRLRKMGRIAAPDRLRTALTFGIPADELPVAEVQSFMASSAGRPLFIAERLSEKTVGRLFEHIDSFPDIEIEDPQDFVLALADVCEAEYAVLHDAKSESQMFGLALGPRAWVTIQRRLDRVEARLRRRILRALILEGKSRPELATEAVVACHAQIVGKGTEDETGKRRQWFTAKETAHICSGWANRTLSALVDIKFPAPRARHIYRAARYVCPSRLRRLLATALRTDAGLDRFAAVVGRTGVMSPGGPFVEIRDAELAECGDVKAIRRKAALRLKRLPKGADVELRSILRSLATGKAYFTANGKDARP